jgi:cell division protein FtsZ
MHHAEVAEKAAASTQQPGAGKARAKDATAAPRGAAPQPKKEDSFAKSANGEIWSGPDDVVIRERTPQPSSRSSTPSGTGQPAARKPARGDDLSRLPAGQPSRRPMPTVEDFPPVAQREYWAKTAGARRAQAQQPAPKPEPPPARRMGLLERITGARRAKANAATAAAERSGDEPLDMPVFFRREQND